MDEFIAKIAVNDPYRTWIDYRCLRSFEDATEERILESIDALLRNRYIERVTFKFHRSHLSKAVCAKIGLLLRETSVIKYIAFPHGMTNAEFQLIAPSLELNTTLDTLNLSRCDISGRVGGEMIQNVLLRNRGIVNVYLDGNKQFGADGMACLAQVLGSADCQVKDLDLWGCNIGNDGAQSLCLALERNSVLECVRLCENGITAAGFSAFARSAPRMKGLKKIAFTWYEGPTPEDLESLIRGLHRNHDLVDIEEYKVVLLSEEQFKAWNACAAFVETRNKMTSYLDKVGAAASGHGGGETPPTPIPMDHLLGWCSRQSGLQPSLIHYLLRIRASDAFSGLENKQGTRRKRTSEA